MAAQIGEYNAINTVLFEDAVSVKEECQDEDFASDKIHISETAITVDNAPLQDHLRDKIKQYYLYGTMDNIESKLSLSDVQYDLVHDNLKREEEISADEIKIEFNSRLLYCEDCQAYREDYCAECEMLVHILNRTVPINADNRSQEQLPHDILEIKDYCGQLHIFALKVIPVGVRFGPFTGLNATEHTWKIKGGKFVINKNKSMHLNWMLYINPARNITEQNLLIFQYIQDLYYESTRRIEEGEELLVYFGEEYEDSLKRNVEMEFIPAAKHIFKDAFACTFCCLGFSSKLCLSNHKTICPAGFSIEELIQCPSCQIYLDSKEYTIHHQAHCRERNDRKCILSTPDVTGRKTRPRLMYNCQKCKYRTNYKGDLKNHTNQHSDVKVYKCGVCCRRFKTKEVLRLHVESKNICAGGKADLEHYAGLYMNVTIKANHSCSQQGTKQFKCSLCEFQTQCKINLKEHMAEKHLTEFKYKCDTCDYNTNWKSQLKRHIERRHMNEYKYKCDTCDYKTNLKANLERHIEAKHLKEYKYKCDSCDYKANFKSLVKTHIETQHLKSFKYKCESCDYKTNLRFKLKAHVGTRHLKQFKFKCDTCDYKVNRKSSLKRHIVAKHSNEFKYECAKCEYKTNWESNLKGHIRARHLKEFSFKCDICDYKANQKAHLKKHIEGRHLKEFKYKCDICDYKANYKSSLKIHIETKHLEVVKYKCGTCNYKANYKSSLDIHVKTKHLKEFKYKCDTCGYKTNNTSHLTRHMKAKHL